ncbi:molybdenum cofactor biosynthesis protein MoaE [Paracoccaceae bacterium]|nr:molybdenum cofactor biosynthesis protein MoaE [Paracoccaceae bacterium]
MRILIQEHPFDLGQEAQNFAEKQDNAGAIVTFTGIVRNTSLGDLKTLAIEHYPAMTEKAISDIAQTAIDRWSLQDELVLHRYGNLAPGEGIMMVATAAAHRSDAFAAADYLKSRAPFWKKEITASGANWVEAKDSDEQALRRW